MWLGRSHFGHETGEENVNVCREAVIDTPGGRLHTYKSRQPDACSPAPPFNLQPVLKKYDPLDLLWNFKDWRLAATKGHNYYDFPKVFGDALCETWGERAADGKPGAVPPSDSERLRIKSGDFGPKKDAMFQVASKYALQEKLPVVCLAANSGVRIGLAMEVQDKLKLKQTGRCQLSETHKRGKSRPGKCSFRKGTKGPQGEKQWILTDVIGLEDGLGVECLSGTSAIAGTFSKAFREGFMITLRINQPIILTGFQTLNMLLDHEVYSSHMQLEGPRVMGEWGVTQ
ncbi:hypothetical protein BSKO_12522 [Bryopsis sp. KO-2023]|nr:hypothetical protein BSKO_09282 [Bryopsis sp. KO-2023]GMH44570.1 hypothetical protein BSKO_12522 [Bryopsis sp. KO-2023]